MYMYRDCPWLLEKKPSDTGISRLKVKATFRKNKLIFRNNEIIFRKNKFIFRYKELVFLENKLSFGKKV
jgi:hypothetical protein